MGRRAASILVALIVVVVPTVGASADESEPPAFTAVLLCTSPWSTLTLTGTGFPPDATLLVAAASPSRGWGTHTTTTDAEGVLGPVDITGDSFLVGGDVVTIVVDENANGVADVGEPTVLGTIANACEGPSTTTSSTTTTVPPSSTPTSSTPTTPSSTASDTTLPTEPVTSAPTETTSAIGPVATDVSTTAPSTPASSAPAASVAAAPGTLPRTGAGDASGFLAVLGWACVTAGLVLGTCRRRRLA